MVDQSASDLAGVAHASFISTSLEGEFALVTLFDGEYEITVLLQPRLEAGR